MGKILKMFFTASKKFLDLSDPDKKLDTLCAVLVAYIAGGFNRQFNLTSVFWSYFLPVTCGCCYFVRRKKEKTDFYYSDKMLASIYFGD